MARRSVVDAVAAKPHRAGTARDSWSRMGRPVTGIIPPQKTIDSITEITSIGRIWSCDLAAADIAKEAVATGRSVREIAAERNVLGPGELDEALDVRRMTEGGIVGPGAG